LKLTVKTPFLIRSERLGLRRLSLQDAAAFREMNADAKVMQYFPHPLPAKESDELLVKLIEKEKKYSYGIYAVELLASGEFIGFTGFNHCSFISDFTPCTEIAWRFKSQFWGRGFATEAASACLNHAGKHLDLKDLYAFTAVSNLRSTRVIEKVGFHYVRNFEHPLVDDVRLKEHVLYRSLRIISCCSCIDFTNTGMISECLIPIIASSVSFPETTSGITFCISWAMNPR
jgi:[ribosomal protein S5]-alanine N-acetyltransferase